MLYIYSELSEKKTNELITNGLAKVSSNHVFTFEDLSDDNEYFAKYNLFEFLEIIDGDQYEYLYRQDKYENIQISMKECIDYIIEITEDDEDIINYLSKNIYEAEDPIIEIYHIIDNYALEIVSKKFDEIKRQYEELFQRLSNHTSKWE